MPYSYSRMINFIDQAEKSAKNNLNIYFRKEILGLTISSN
jgi:hypothetical protein